MKSGVTPEVTSEVTLELSREIRSDVGSDAEDSAGSEAKTALVFKDFYNEKEALVKQIFSSTMTNGQRT